MNGVITWIEIGKEIPALAKEQPADEVCHLSAGYFCLLREAGGRRKARHYLRAGVYETHAYRPMVFRFRKRLKQHEGAILRPTGRGSDPIFTPTIVLLLIALLLIALGAIVVWALSHWH
jgi:hypothetical protein